MSIVNLQRDGHFLDPDITPITFGSANTYNDSNPVQGNADPAVYDSHAYARSSRVVKSYTSGNGRSIGCYIQPPGLDLSPYRIKIYAESIIDDLQTHFIIGYAPNTITGTDDDIDVFQTMPFIRKFDELIMVQPQGAPTGNALYMGIVCTGVSTNTVVNASISVQRLATSPPQFAQSVS